MSTPAERVDGIAHDLEATVARFVRERRLPGAATGVVVGDELAWSFGYGFADVETERPSLPTDLYRIASITKTFTATAIMQLRDEGRLRLDDPMVTHLPELATATSPFGPIETVTIRRLLSHESGLMGDPPGTQWLSRTYETDVATVLGSPELIHTRVPVNTQTKYSNLAFQLLGEIVTRCSGVPYADHVRANILEPLGMTSTAFDPPPTDLAARCATGYDPRGFSDRLVPATPMGEPVAPVAEGGLWSSVEDLGRWVVAQLRTDAPARGGDRVLDGATLREMHRPRYLTDAAWTEAYAIGWYARRRGDDIWIQHSGGLPGFITNVCFHASERVGAIALLNGDGPASELSMTLGRAALDAVGSAVEPATPPAPVPEAFAPLLGLYMNTDMNGPARVEWRDGRLRVLSPDYDPDWVATLAPTDDPLAFTVEPGIRESGEPAVFERTPDGRIRSLTLASDLFWRLEPVDRG
jgi:CubicO group peptidase (beta-lactamase class C family)